MGRPAHISALIVTSSQFSDAIPRGQPAELPATGHSFAPAIDALYLHSPFCFHKCHYCDFYSIVNPDDQPQRPAQFTDRLLAELDHRLTQFRILPRTIFFGGGTPTLLPVPLLQRLFDHLRQRGITEHADEFTVEANPETVTDDLARALVAGGVRRVSLGAQSFHPHLLKTLERWHDPDNVARAVDRLRNAGVIDINLDLIFAIPGQTQVMLDADLDFALALRPDHLSCYGLTYEPHTAMTKRLELRQFTAIDENTERDMYALVMARLDDAGFEHYEISNWARRDPALPVSSPSPHRCRHNLAYWHNLNWLGIGPSAASHVSGWRWKNVPHLGQYLDQQPEPPMMDVEHLDEDPRDGEQLMLRLRLLEGVDHDTLHALLRHDDPRWAAIDQLVQLGMLERDAGHVKLSREGLFLADAVLAKLL
ncbi:MAG: radical SAM family heme chaperone HemW [Phycisphaeraceae bacterium]|nr:radical SAM family heme chaperone HemW [Phycisphaeraceae bacterium]